MSKSVDMPTEYTIHSTLSGSLDMDLDNIRIKEIAPVTLSTDSNLNSTSTMDMGLDDIGISVKELPRIRLEVAMKPTRIHFPVNYKFGLCTMGMELFAFCVCGESMVIVEDYHPHSTEHCA